MGPVDALLAVVLTVSVVSDLRSRRLHDAVTWPAMGLAVMTHAGLNGWGDVDSGVVSSVFGAVAAMGLFGLVALFGRFGWGDVKLLGFCGAALGLMAVPTLAGAVSLAGLVQAVLASVLRRGDKGLAYAVAISAGAVVTRWWVF